MRPYAWRVVARARAAARDDRPDAGAAAARAAGDRPRHLEGHDGRPVVDHRRSTCSCSCSSFVFRYVAVAADGRRLPEGDERHPHAALPSPAAHVDRLLRRQPGRPPRHAPDERHRRAQRAADGRRDHDHRRRLHDRRRGDRAALPQLEARADHARHHAVPRRHHALVRRRHAQLVPQAAAAHRAS